MSPTPSAGWQSGKGGSRSWQRARWRPRPGRRRPTPATPRADPSVQLAWWCVEKFPCLSAAALLFLIATGSFHHCLPQQIVLKCRHLHNTGNTITGECSSFLLPLSILNTLNTLNFPLQCIEQWLKSKMQEEISAFKLPQSSDTFLSQFTGEHVRCSVSPILCTSLPYEWGPASLSHDFIKNF